MPHVSKRKLEEQVLESLLAQFSGIFKLAGRKNTLNHFTDELFTKTEKIMFAKRLAAILLLNRGMPQHLISEKLNMSPSTISRLSLYIEIREYNNILKIAGQHQETVSSILEVILDNLPQPIGRSRRRYGSMYRSSPSFQKDKETKK